MDIREYQNTIEDLQKQLADKQGELDVVMTKLAALQLKNMAGMSDQVEELTSLKEQLLNAKEQVIETEQQVGRLSELEQIIAKQQLDIARLKEENSLMMAQKKPEQDGSNEATPGSIEILNELPKTALQIRLEKMHNELLTKKRTETKLVEQECEEDHSPREQDGEETESVEPTPSIMIKEENKPIVTIADNAESYSSEQTPAPKAQEADQESGTNLLPTDVLKRWLISH